MQKCAPPFLTNGPASNKVLVSEGAVQHSGTVIAPALAWAVTSDAGRVYNFSQNQSPYLTNMQCANGTPNVDGGCICPSTGNTKPFIGGPLSGDLYNFSQVPGSIKVNPVAQKLTVQRGPDASSYRTMIQ